MAIDAKRSGSFKIGGELEINRLGFGAMRITGDGIWGDPANPQEALRTLKRVPELGVNFIDTADSYGPDVSEQLLKQALHPYPGLVIATKGGQARIGPNQWIPLGRPEYLIQQAHKSLRNLGVEQIDLWQLHRIDPKVPRDEQFDAIAQLQAQGLIRYAGLSEASVDDIKAAQQFFPVATVQNRYNLTDRKHQSVLDYCTEQAIGFIPWHPLDKGLLTRHSALMADLEQKYQATPGQIAIAWLLQCSSVMLPIPGTSKVSHLEQNVAAVDIQLSEHDFKLLDQAGRHIYEH